MSQDADKTTPEQDTDTATAEPRPDEAPEQPAGGDDDLTAALVAAEAKAQENWDKFLRATAEADNARRRAEREVAAAHKYGVEKFARELLGVRDSLELGLKSADAPEASAESLKQGMTLTLKQLTGTMDKMGITQLDPTGEPFNPEHHEAVTMLENGDVAPNTVIDVMQKGYLLADRLLRPAMVVVAKAPTKSAGESE
ncbi:nucleotide exchange factor GrpE [bacterium]|nr:nucleotide exchange factor GrpE [bacterium]